MSGHAASRGPRGQEAEPLDADAGDVAGFRAGHHKGQAVVFEGEVTECRLVQSQAEAASPSAVAVVSNADPAPWMA